MDNTITVQNSTGIPSASMRIAGCPRDYTPQSRMEDDLSVLTVAGCQLTSKIGPQMTRMGPKYYEKERIRPKNIREVVIHVSGSSDAQSRRICLKCLKTRETSGETEPRSVQGFCGRSKNT